MTVGGGPRNNLPFVVSVAALAIAAATFWHSLNDDSIREQLNHEARLSRLESRQESNIGRLDRLERAQDGKLK